MINIYKNVNIKYVIFQCLFYKLLCFKIELKFISLKTDNTGFFNTLFIAVWIKLSSLIKKALYIVDCRDEIISKSTYLWALL